MISTSEEINPAVSNKVTEANFFEKIKGMVWKNYRLLKREKWSFWVEMAMPIICAGILAVVKSYGKVTVGKFNGSVQYCNGNSGDTCIIPPIDYVQPSWLLLSVNEIDYDFMGLSGFLFVCAYAVPFSRLVSILVEEKKSISREISSSNVWISWFIPFVLIFLFINVGVSIIANHSIFNFSSFSIILTTFLTFSCSLGCLSFLASVFLSKFCATSFLSFFLLLIIYFPFMATGIHESFLEIQFASLSSPIGFAFALRNLFAFESSNILSLRDFSYLHLRYNDSADMLIIDCFLYVFLGWYFDTVLSGTTQDWFFLFTPTFWKKLFDTSDFISLNNFNNIKTEVSLSFLNENTFERVHSSVSSRNCIQITQLQKSFDNNLVIKNLDLAVYEGQIFVLLGPSGSGKTTVLNLLTGNVKPSSGSILVHGLELDQNLEIVRKLYGSMHCVESLYQSLTCQEHLEFYATMNGISKEQTESEVATVLQNVGLLDMKNIFISNLNYSEKKLLCLGLTIIGHSKILLLDEPTKGVNAYSRRIIWKCLSKYKLNRLVLITTNCIEEADYLSDRVGIMQHGSLKCCGSPSFLKSLYGIGFNLSLYLTETANIIEINNTVVRYFPCADVFSCVGKDLSFRLPMVDSLYLSEMLEEFDSKLELLGIVSYNISPTSLEEVYVRVSDEDLEEILNEKFFDDSAEPENHIATNNDNSKLEESDNEEFPQSSVVIHEGVNVLHEQKQSEISTQLPLKRQKTDISFPIVAAFARFKSNQSRPGIPSFNGLFKTEMLHIVPESRDESKEIDDQGVTSIASVSIHRSRVKSKRNQPSIKYLNNHQKKPAINSHLRSPTALSFHVADIRNNISNIESTQV